MFDYLANKPTTIMSKLICIIVGFALVQAVLASKIQPGLQKTFTKSGTADVLVSFVGKKSGDVLNQLRVSNDFSRATSRVNRLAMISTALRAHAGASQRSVLDWLEANKATVKKVQSLWITNQLYIRGASRGLVNQLAQFPEVSIIEEDRWLPLETTPADFAPGRKENGPFAEWGIENIRAPAVWNSPGGNMGENIIVANIDTGVRWTHEALVDNFLGEYGWLDPYESTPEPNDIIGQGTHAMGTMAGSKGIGVAPGAKWAACKGCEFTCPFSTLLACGEFFTCPNPADGCSLAPHVITNGWRANRGDNSYNEVIRAWRLGGIIPIFTNGNVGPACSTAVSPGDSVEGVIAVSLTTPNNTLSDRSSKGPAINALIKPDIIAPGELINSASHLSDNGYSLLSGVAQPSVGGTVALLLSKNPNFTFDHVSKLLADGAAKWLPHTGQNCGGIADSVFPNHSVGNGKVDAFSSFMLARNRNM